MKTVIDAVNEFKGVWIYDEPSIVEQISTGNLSSWRELCDHGLNKFNFRLVCNEEQFNQCLDEMATNYGTSETYTNYKANYEMINDDMKPVIDWSKAPEGTTHYGHESALYYGGFYKINHNEEMFFHDKDQWLDCISTPELTKRPKPEVKPVTPAFTQAMADAGTLPSVGMELLGRQSEYEDWCEIEVLFVNEDVIYCRESDKIAHYHFSKADKGIQFKPLTPPIELIDGKAYQFTNENTTIENGIYYDGMMVNQHGNTALMLCTNIQLLEVKS